MPKRSDLDSTLFPPSKPWDALSESQHLEYYAADRLVSEFLHLLGYLDFKDALPYSIGPAQHVETLELSYCARGKMKWNIEGKEFWFVAGDVLITPPGSIRGIL